MTNPRPRNIAASVHQRLLDKSKDSARPFNELFQYYAIERFLYRLSRSSQTRRHEQPYEGFLGHPASFPTVRFRRQDAGEGDCGNFRDTPHDCSGRSDGIYGGVHPGRNETSPMEGLPAQDPDGRRPGCLCGCGLCRFRFSPAGRGPPGESSARSDDLEGARTVASLRDPLNGAKRTGSNMISKIVCAISTDYHLTTPSAAPSYP